ncbi:hypothetical protein [Novosphingobium sp. B 225]|uniref:hypothetical protein n=1 Tax=Novosphingobium sp. B 225 TaxID=1961849 RepID=UPI000B4BEC2C|nr:hypothetical protein [Novosphingobium sp. B 225]
MAKRTDLPKRLAARIRAAQERVRQKRLGIVYAEKNYEQSRARVDAYEEDPIAFAARFYQNHEWDSYPVQANLATNRERNECHERRREERIKELAELESALMRTEELVLAEVTRMRPTTGRVPWPRSLPAFTKFRAQLEMEMRREDERWRAERARDDAEFERMIAHEESALEELQELGDKELLRDLAAMSPSEYANYRAWADYFVLSLRSGSLGMQDILSQVRSNKRAR